MGWFRLDVEIGQKVWYPTGPYIWHSDPPAPWQEATVHSIEITKHGAYARLADDEGRVCACILVERLRLAKPAPDDTPSWWSNITGRSRWYEEAA